MTRQDNETKKSIWSLATVLVLAVSGIVLNNLRDARLWPFSTGANDEAFLGTTFGMSPQEVQRALKKQGAQLVDYDEYKRIESLPIIKKNIYFQPLFSEDIKKESSLYMPSIEMYESKVEAEFTFRESRLEYVAVYFDPVAQGKAQTVADSIEAKLKTAYESPVRENSKDVSGAYTVRFTSPSSKPSLWVNLTEPAHPIIILYLLHPKTEVARQRQIEQREQTAFGSQTNRQAP